MALKLFQALKSISQKHIFLIVSISSTLLVLIIIIIDFPKDFYITHESIWDDSPVIVDADLNLSQFNNPPEFILTITELTLSSINHDFDFSDKNVCIQRIYVLPILRTESKNKKEIKIARLVNNSWVEFEDKCFEFSSPWDFRWIFEISPVSITYDNRNFLSTKSWYPFDNYTQSIALFSQIQIEGEDDVRIVPIRLRLNTPNIQNTTPVKIENEEMGLEIDTTLSFVTEYFESTILTYQITRPFTTKLLTILIPLTIIFYLFLLATIDDIPSAAGIALGIFLGLWSINSVLVPVSIGRSHIVEIIIVLLYMLFAWISIYRFFIRKDDYIT